MIVIFMGQLHPTGGLDLDSKVHGEARSSRQRLPFGFMPKR